MIKQPLYWHKKRGMVGMSLTAELVLNLLHDHGPMPIMEIMELASTKGVASLPTIHGALKWLTTLGFIKIKPRAEDTRTKICVCTPKATRYLE